MKPKFRLFKTLSTLSPINAFKGVGPILITAVLGGQSAQAASGTWLNTGVTDGNWTTTSNWFGGTVPGSTVAITGTNANADIATFDTALGTFGTSGSPILIDSTSENIKGITFDTAAGNYFIGTTAGNPLFLSSGGTIQILGTLSATNAVETINAPIVIEGAGGTYIFANNSANGTGAGAGTLNLGGQISGDNAGATVLTLSGTNSNANIISGNIVNGSATTLALTKTGVGTWILSGNNTFSGGLKINDNGGIVAVTNASGLGTGPITIGSGGGGLVTGEIQLSNNITITTAGNISLAQSRLNFAGGGSANLENLSGANSLNSNLSIDNFGGNGANILSTAGTLTLTGTLSSTATGTRTYDFSGAGNTIVSGNILPGTFSATAVQKDGLGTLTLSGANTYTGTTTISAGTVSIGANNNLGAAAAAVSLNGGTLSTTAFITNTHAVTVGASGGTINVKTTGQYYFNTTNALLGSGALTVTGNGTLTVNTGNLRIDHANTYSGAVTINSGGIFEYGVAGAVGAGATFTIGNQGELAGQTGATLPNNITVSGGTNSVLSFENGTTGIFSGGITLNANAIVGLRDWYNNATVRSGTISGNISGTGGLTVNSGTGSGGTLTLSGTNNYSGATSLAASTLEVRGASALSTSSAVTMNSGTTLSLKADSDTTFTPASIAVAGSGNVSYNYNVGAITGGTTGKILTLANVATQWGPASTTDTFNLTGGAGSGYTLALGSGAAGTGGLNFYNNTTVNSNTAGVTLKIAGGLSVNFNANYTLGFGGAGNITVGGLVNNQTSGGQKNLTPTFGGSGVIQLDGANNFGAATGTISTTGTLKLNNAAALTGLSALTISGAATIDNITASAITLAGNPTQSWNSDFTFTGTNALNLGTGAVTMGASRQITVNGTGATGMLTVGGAISGGGFGLTKAGTGTLTLTSASSAYTGATLVNAGRLTVSGAGTLASTGLSVASGALFSYQPTAIGTTLTLGTGSTLNLADGSGLVLGWNTTVANQVKVLGAATVGTGTGVGVDMGSGFTSATAYTILQAGSGLDSGNYYLLNPTNYTASFTKSPTQVQITPTTTTALTAAFWKGTATAGLTNVWAASNGASDSNWASSAGGSVQALVPGSGADVTISANSPTVAPTNTVLGDNMTIKSLTIADTTNGLILNADVNTLTITPASSAVGITMNSGVPNSSIAAGVALGAAQTWTNNSTTNQLTVSGNIDNGTKLLTVVAGTTSSGTAAGTVISGILSNTGGLTLTSGNLSLTGANTYTGTTSVSAGTLSLSGPRTATSGSINVGNLNGSTGTLNVSNGTFSTGTFQVGNGNGTAVGVINQTGGTLTLSGGANNQFLLGNGGAVGAAAGNGGNGTYNLSAGSLITSSSGNRGIMLGTNDGGTSTFNLSGTGVLNASNALLMVGRSDAPTPNTTNLFNQTGGTATAGTLTIGGAAGAATGLNSTFTATGGTFKATNFTFLGAGNSGVVTMNIGGTAVVTLPAFPTVHGTGTTTTINFDGGTLKNSAPSAGYMGGLTNAFIKAGGATFDTAAGSITIIQALLTHGVSTGGGLTKVSSNTLTLTGANTFTGNTDINGGTLVAAQTFGNNDFNPTSSALGNPQVARNINVNNGGTLQFGAGDTFGGATTTVASTLVINSGGTVTAGGVFTTLGAVNLNGGTLTGTSGSGDPQFQMFSLLGTVTVGGSSASTISGPGVVSTGGYHLAAAGTTFNVPDVTTSSAVDLTVSGTLIDTTGAPAAASLIKTGAGTMVLSGTNTYTGSTAINAGTLALGASGSIASTTVSVAAGAVLDTTAKATYTLPTALTLGINGTSGTSGKINATGQALVINGSAVTFNVTGTLTAPAYVLATYGSISGTATFGSIVGSIPTGYTINYAYNSGTQIALVKSGYDSWTSSFLLTGADALPGADPDNDGIKNLLEYVLGGNPTVSSQSILPVLDASGANFIFTFNRGDDSETDTTQAFEYGNDLTGWTDVTIGAVSSGPDGNGVTVGVVENGTTPDAITVTVPKGTNPKLFGRLQVVK